MKAGVDVVGARFCAANGHVAADGAQEAQSDRGLPAAGRGGGNQKTHRLLRRGDASGGSLVGKMMWVGIVFRQIPRDVRDPTGQGHVVVRPLPYLASPALAALGPIARYK